MIEETKYTNHDTITGKSFSYSIGDVPGDSFKYWGQQGWVCPKCGAVLSPWTSECPHCSPGLNKITTSPNTNYKFPDDYAIYVKTLPKTYSSDTSNITSTSAGPNPNITAKC